MTKNKTYMDKLMEDKEFRERFDKEYQNLCIGEQIAMARHQAHLTQSVLAKRIHTTKSAISRYESADYSGYSLPLLTRIAKACGTDIKIVFVARRTKKVHELQVYKILPGAQTLFLWGFFLIYAIDNISLLRDLVRLVFLYYSSA